MAGRQGLISMRTELGVVLIRGGVFDPFSVAERGVASPATMKLKAQCSDLRGGAFPARLCPDPPDLPLSFDYRLLARGMEEEEREFPALIL